MRIAISRALAFPLALAAALACAAPAAADIVFERIDNDGDGFPEVYYEEWTEVLYPHDGQVFRVGSPSDTVSITAQAASSIGYFARAELDTLPFTGQSTGGALTHTYELIFDGTSTFHSEIFTIPNGPDLIPGDWDAYEPLDWEWYESMADGAILQQTKDCAVGRHFVRVNHKVVDWRTEIHFYATDAIEFWVIPVPLPPAASMGLAMLGGLALITWFRTRKL